MDSDNDEAVEKRRLNDSLNSFPSETYRGMKDNDIAGQEKVNFDLAMMNMDKRSNEGSAFFSIDEVSAQLENADYMVLAINDYNN